ncbi:MAG: Hsp33 family molecular chaperone HslO [Neomegalonema sp.]|nr:Hsp33 family molecular chaperone HslO [Neomegalonema sp.]
MLDQATSEGGADFTPAGGDVVLPFQLDRLDLRGRVCRLDRTLNDILAKHDYPPSICGLIGEAVLLTALIGEAMKLRGRFSLQARSDETVGGPVKLIATDYFAPTREGAPAQMRAYAQFDRERTPERTDAPHELLGYGLFGMVIDQGFGGAPYQGVVPLGNKGLSAAAEAYFAQSEQIASRFKIAIAAETGADGQDHWRAGGVMLQHLAPLGESVAASEAEAAAGKYAAEREPRMMNAADVASMSQSGEEWGHANVLLDTAEETELLGPHVAIETLLVRLFNQDQPRIFAPQKLEFGCTCAREKVADVLRRYPEATLREMTTDAGEITADCQFCGAHYRFTLAEALGKPVSDA